MLGWCWDLSGDMAWSASVGVWHRTTLRVMICAPPGHHDSREALNRATLPNAGTGGAASGAAGCDLRSAPGMHEERDMVQGSATAVCGLHEVLCMVMSGPRPCRLLPLRFRILKHRSRQHGRPLCAMPSGSPPRPRRRRRRGPRPRRRSRFRSFPPPAPRGACCRRHRSWQTPGPGAIFRLA